MLDPVVSFDVRNFFNVLATPLLEETVSNRNINRRKNAKCTGPDQ